MIITNSIEKKRRDANITQESLAKMVGVSQSTISMIESGDRTPSLPVMVRIAAALGCTVDELLGKDSA